MKWIEIFMILFLACAFCQAAEPYYADLTKVANSSPEDDGVANNGKGGWSDEGVNDMFVAPALPKGVFERNGYHFKILDPVKNDKKSIIMLSGKNVTIKYPQSVTVPIADQKVKYIYFLQSYVRNPPKLPGHYVVATYTLNYADGTFASKPVHEGAEIRNWWTKAWYDNSGSKSWPIHMGKNLYSIKWKYHVGVWAMQWKNPYPRKAIKSITLKSSGKAAPAIFAITLTNENYAVNPDLKKDFKRPADIPPGYFDKKQAVENQLIFQELVKSGHAKGIRAVNLIRNDVLAVTVDPAWGKIGVGPGVQKAIQLQKRANFFLVSTQDANYKTAVTPDKVGRFSTERWKGDVGAYPLCIVYWHTYYLFLPNPLKPGATYSITLKGMGSQFKGNAQFAYDAATSATPVIKVNQVAYSSAAKQRYAYLGWWAGDAGAIDYADLKKFTVINEKTKQTILEGKVTLRAKGDKLSGEDVYEMDISSLTQGVYHIRIPGLGRSASFSVGGKDMDKLARVTQRAFYHQRCGMELKEPYTTFTKPACHTEVYRSGRLVGADDYTPKPNEPIRRFKYGYHDAADFDCFTYHLRATAETLNAYEMFPMSFGDDLNIPESDNKLPDVLDEADWALRGYLELQRPDGAIPLGRGNDQDYIRGLRRKGKNPEYGILPPETTSSAEYAAVAALYARIIRPFDKKRATDYLASSIRAFRWALANPGKGPHSGRGNDLFLTAWAAAELFAATGEKQFSDVFVKLHKQGAITKSHYGAAVLRPTVAWPYITTTQLGVDKAVQEELKKMLFKMADRVVKLTQIPAYRMGVGEKSRGLGWGNANGGGQYGVVCLLAWKLSGRQKYIDAASLNADFQLGANPISKTFITGLGVRPPIQPQISSFLYTQPQKRGKTVEGISIYGLSSRDVAWYPADVPPWRRYRDIGNGGAEICSEFTITQTIGKAAMLYGVLNALESRK